MCQKLLHHEEIKDHLESERHRFLEIPFSTQSFILGESKRAADPGSPDELHLSLFHQLHGMFWESPHHWWVYVLPADLFILCDSYGYTFEVFQGHIFKYCNDQFYSIISEICSVSYQAKGTSIISVVHVSHSYPLHVEC